MENIIFCAVLLENAFPNQKIESRHFYSYPLEKILSQVLMITPKEWEITHFSQASLFQKSVVPSEEKGGLRKLWWYYVITWLSVILLYEW